LLVLLPIQAELLGPKSGEAACHLGEHLASEAVVLLRGQIEESVEAIASFYCC
jgi:hypothetical protein